jgi:hypothetical protein
MKFPFIIAILFLILGPPGHTGPFDLDKAVTPYVRREIIENALKLSAEEQKEFEKKHSLDEFVPIVLKAMSEDEKLILYEYGVKKKSTLEIAHVAMIDGAGLSEAEMAKCNTIFKAYENALTKIQKLISPNLEVELFSLGPAAPVAAAVASSKQEETLALREKYFGNSLLQEKEDTGDIFDFEQFKLDFRSKGLKPSKDIDKNLETYFQFKFSRRPPSSPNLSLDKLAQAFVKMLDKGDKEELHMLLFERKTIMDIAGLINPGAEFAVYDSQLRIQKMAEGAFKNGNKVSAEEDPSRLKLQAMELELETTPGSQYSVRTARELNIFVFKNNRYPNENGTREEKRLISQIKRDFKTIGFKQNLDEGPRLLILNMLHKDFFGGDGPFYRASSESKKLREKIAAVTSFPEFSTVFPEIKIDETKINQNHPVQSLESQITVVDCSIRESKLRPAHRRPVHEVYP